MLIIDVFVSGILIINYTIFVESTLKILWPHFFYSSFSLMVTNYKQLNFLQILYEMLFLCYSNIMKMQTHIIIPISVLVASGLVQLHWYLKFKMNENPHWDHTHTAFGMATLSC
jgi:hypothetical protein